VEHTEWSFSWSSKEFVNPAKLPCHSSAAYYANLSGAVHRVDDRLRDDRALMHLDTRSLVTAGIGQMLPDAASGTPAPPEAIRTDFECVRAPATPTAASPRPPSPPTP